MSIRPGNDVRAMILTDAAQAITFTHSAAAPTALDIWVHGYEVYL